MNEEILILNSLNEILKTLNIIGWSIVGLTIIIILK